MGDDARTERWIGTWGCAPQRIESENLPPPPGLAGRTLRQIVAVSIGGVRVRVRLSNVFGDGPVTLREVRLAGSLGGDATDPSTDRALKFAGAPEVTIPAGGIALSDPTDFVLAPLGRLAVTISFGETPPAITGHPGSRTTSYLQPGVSGMERRMPGAVTTDHWYYLHGIDVAATAPGAGAIVALGDSLTDGRGSTTNGHDRWPDLLAARLQASSPTRQVAVLNQGLGGNAVLAGGVGPPAIERFERDVLGQPGARWLILLHGVNDLGLADRAEVTAALIAAFERFAGLARGRGLRVYGSPILPFAGSIYDGPERERRRQEVNAWIRSSGRFDAVIDFDAAVRDPGDPARLLPAYDTGDRLHLNPAGYRAMAEAVDLSLFLADDDETPCGVES